MDENATRLFILDVQQESPDKPDMHIWCKTEKDEPVLVIDRSFRPYFYVEYAKDTGEKEVGELQSKLSELIVDGNKPEKVELAEKKFYGKKKHLMRITLTRPVDITKFSDHIKEWKEIKAKYEHSVTFFRRYMTDRKMIPMTWIDVTGASDTGNGFSTIYAESITSVHEDAYPKLSMMAIDIELVEEGELDKVIMVSIKDNRGFKKVISYKKADVDFLEVVGDEKELLKRLCEVVRGRNPDIIVTYNGDRFDFEKISQRAKVNGLHVVIGRTGNELKFKKRGKFYSAWIEGRVHVDLYNFVDNIISDTLSSESLSLDNVSREIIGRGKRKMEWEELQKAWKESKGLERLVKYCMTDSELTVSLAKVLLPQIFELCRIAGQTLFDASRLTYSQLIEWLLVRKAYEADEIIPNRPKYEEMEIRRRAAPYTGGYVYPPKEGIHKKLALFDFASLYPSITITHNISPETLYCQCCGDEEKGPTNKVPGEDYYYCKAHPGFVSGTVKELIEKRRELKASMQEMDEDSDEYKVTNSRQYALKILANASYGYYGYAGSRWYSRVCAQSITAWGRYYIQKVIRKAEKMGHEVVYGDTDSLFVKVKSKKESLELLDEVNRTLPGAMELEFQGIYTSGLFVPAKTGLAAKKRYALIDSDGEITIRGLEIVRRDWSGIAKDTQEKVLLSILRDNSPEDALVTVRRAVQKIEKGKVSMDDLVIHTQITRPLKEYEQISPHVVAARKSISRGRTVAQGSVIAYVITKGSGSISERAEPSEDAENYDPEYYINNQVVPAAMRILSALGYTEDDVVSEGETQYSLQNFVGKKK